ncbi:MAG: hypothetical protein ABIH23_35680 [bacterium]
MTDEPTAERVEKEVDGWSDLAKRRPVLCAGVAFILITYAVWTFYVFNVQENQIQETDGKLNSERAARYHAEEQLAPFLAAANQQYPDEPPDKRVGLLVEELRGGFQEVEKHLAPQRRISPEAKQRTIEDLREQEPMSVEIYVSNDDGEAWNLANDIAGLFPSAGWSPWAVVREVRKDKIDELRSSKYSVRQYSPHLFWQCSRMPDEKSDSLSLALQHISKDLGYGEIDLLVGDSIVKPFEPAMKPFPPNTLRIIVGPK